MLYYTIKNIKLFAKNKTGIFIFFLVCLFFSSLMAIYIYAQFESNNASLGNFSEMKDAAIYIYTDDDFDYSAFEDKLNSLSKDDIDIESFAYMFNAEIDEDIDYDDEFLIKTETLTFLAYSSQNIENEKISSLNAVSSGTGISDKQIQNGDCVCLMSGSDMGVNITIHDVKYETVGCFDISDNLAYGIIPYTSVTGNDLKPDAVIITLGGTNYKNYLAVSSKALKTLEKAFPEYTMETAAREGAYSTSLSDGVFSFENLLELSMLLLVILTLCSLYSFIFNLREKKYAVFKICGARSESIAAMCVAEIIILTACCFALAALAFYALNKTVLIKYQPVFAYTVRAKTYLVSFAAVLLMIFVIFGIFSLIKSKISPVELLADSKKTE